MTEKLTAGEWMTKWDRLRFRLIRRLLKPGDAYLLAEGLHREIVLSREHPGITDVQTIKKMFREKARRRQLYYVLRWMQRNEK